MKILNTNQRMELPQEVLQQAFHAAEEAIDPQKRNVINGFN